MLDPQHTQYDALSSQGRKAAEDWAAKGVVLDDSRPNSARP